MSTIDRCLFWLSLLICLVGCAPAERLVGLSPLAADSLLPVSASAEEELVRAYMERRLGIEYLAQHFRLLAVERVGGLIKASYAYSYEPHVDGYSMTLFLDADGLDLAVGEVSTALLEPQEFDLDPEDVLEVAVAHGLDGGQAHTRELYQGPETGNRFVWIVTGAPGPDAGRPQGTSLSVAVDVEDGRVHFSGWVGMGISH